MPGGFVEEGEQVLEAAPRELAEETGLQLSELRLLGVYDTPGRDPRGWTVSVVYLAYVPNEAMSPAPMTPVTHAGLPWTACPSLLSIMRSSLPTRWRLFDRRRGQDSQYNPD